MKKKNTQTKTNKKARLYNCIAHTQKIFAGHVRFNFDKMTNRGLEIRIPLIVVAPSKYI